MLHPRPRLVERVLRRRWIGYWGNSDVAVVFQIWFVISTSASEFEHGGRRPRVVAFVLRDVAHIEQLDRTAAMDVSVLTALP